MKKVLLLGAGYMAKEYAKVFDAMGISYDVFTRNSDRAKEYESITGKKAFSGDIDKYLMETNILYTHAVNAYKAEALTESTIILLENGIKNILCEKPAGLNIGDIKRIYEKSNNIGAKVYVAYNRRFYSSVLEAQKIIEQDGGLLSIDYEFTEWLHLFGIDKLKKELVRKIFIGNSSHVLDMAFYLGGRPRKYIFWSDYNAERTKGIFAGAGITDKEIPFTYHANWSAPGRWGIELMTSKHRLIFRPLEKLLIQELKSVSVTEVDIDDKLDTDYKPGVYMETKTFLEGDKDENLKIIEEQFLDIDLFEKMMYGSNSYDR